MIMIHLKVISRISFFFMIVALSFGTPEQIMAKTTGDIVTEGSSIQLPVGRLALLPFVKGDFAEEFRQKNLSPLTCPINQVCIDLNEGDETLLFVESLDKYLYKIIKKRVGEELLPMRETKIQYNDIPFDPYKDTTLSRALLLARNMKSDYVLVPILWEYSERVGSQLSAEKPASVSFGLYLISVKQEKRVWKANFNKTQMALTDDLLKAKDIFKFGGKWVSAEELAQVGMQKIIENFPLAQ